MKTTCSVCFVVGSVLLFLVVCMESYGTLPGISATEDMCYTVAGLGGPCENGGTGECKVVGTQSVCSAGNIGLTCGTNYGPIDQVCADIYPETPCDTWSGFCENYKKCYSHPTNGAYCGASDEEAHSWRTCTMVYVGG